MAQRKSNKRKPQTNSKGNAQSNAYAAKLASKLFASTYTPDDNPLLENYIGTTGCVIAPLPMIKDRIKFIDATWPKAQQTKILAGLTPEYLNLMRVYDFLKHKSDTLESAYNSLIIKYHKLQEKLDEQKEKDINEQKENELNKDTQQV